MSFFGIGIQELLFVLIIALIVLGPTRMAGSARKAGKMVREFRHMTEGLPKSLEDLEKLAANSEQPKKPAAEESPAHVQPWRPPGAEQPERPKPTGGA